MGARQLLAAARRSQEEQLEGPTSSGGRGNSVSSAGVVAAERPQNWNKVPPKRLKSLTAPCVMAVCLDATARGGGERGGIWGQGVLTCLSRWVVANGADDGGHSTCPTPPPYTHTHTDINYTRRRERVQDAMQCKMQCNARCNAMQDAMQCKLGF